MSSEPHMMHSRHVVARPATPRPTANVPGSRGVRIAICARASAPPLLLGAGRANERYSYVPENPAPASLHRHSLRGKKQGCHTRSDKGFNRRLARGIHNRLLGGAEPKERRSKRIPCHEFPSVITSRCPRQRRQADRISCPRGLGKVPIFLGCTDVSNVFLTSLVEEFLKSQARSFRECS